MDIHAWPLLNSACKKENIKDVLFIYWVGFFLSFLSGLAEPVGAIIGYFILLPFLNDSVFGLLFGAVAGIMVFISLDELLPTAREYGEHHLAIYGLIGGMMVMAVSLLLFT